MRNSRPKILLVEDHPMFREGLRKILEDQEGCYVTAVESGTAALEAFQPQTFALAVVAWGLLPDMDGVKLVDRLKDKESTLKIILISLDDEPEEHRANAFVDKRDPEKLWQTVRSLLPK